MYCLAAQTIIINMASLIMWLWWIQIDFLFFLFLDKHKKQSDANSTPLVIQVNELKSYPNTYFYFWAFDGLMQPT
jgi:hypothetical protein